MQLLPHHLSISVDLLSSSFVFVIFSKIPNGIFSVFLIFSVWKATKWRRGKMTPPPNDASLKSSRKTSCRRKCAPKSKKPAGPTILRILSLYEI